MNIAKSQFVLRISLIFASCLAALCLFEIPAFFNLLDYRGIIGLNSAWWPENFVSDPELVHIRRTHSRLRGNTKGGSILLGYRIPASDLSPYEWDVRYDHNGFRNPADLIRANIVVVGDSIVEGMTVPDAQIATTILQQLQHRSVANLGQPGYGPQQELIVLKRYGLPLMPQTVVWMFFEGNDLSDVEHYDDMMRRPKSAFWHNFPERSFTRNALRRLPVTRPRGIEVSGILETADGGKTTIYFAGAAADSALPLDGHRLAALEKTKLVVETAYKLSAAQSARFIFVFIPDKFRTLHGSCRFSGESKCRKWTANDLPARMSTAIGSISPRIGYLDLTPSLVKAGKAGAVAYYPDDEHFEPAGHRIAAEAISSYMASYMTLTEHSEGSRPFLAQSARR
jgi:hypothetical protein